MRCIKTALITKMSKNRQNRKVRQFCPLDFISYRKGKHQFSKGGKPNYAVCYLLEVYGILRNSRVFLQHGVILTNIDFLYYKNTKMSMFVTSTYREWEYVNNNYGYPEAL